MVPEESVKKAAQGVVVYPGATDAGAQFFFVETLLVSVQKTRYVLITPKSWERPEGC